MTPKEAVPRIKVDFNLRKEQQSNDCSDRDRSRSHRSQPCPIEFPALRRFDAFQTNSCEEAETEFSQDHESGWRLKHVECGNIFIKERKDKQILSEGKHDRNENDNPAENNQWLQAMEL